MSPPTEIRAKANHGARTSRRRHFAFRHNPPGGTVPHRAGWEKPPEDFRGLPRGRYSSRPLSEIDTLAEVFRALVLAREDARLAPCRARLDLVTLGTLADLMPLVDENRILVREGLHPRAPERNGLRQIFKRKELLGKRISASDIAWQVAPLVNSAGRMGGPETATRVFLSETAEEADSLVDQLVSLDSRRRTMGETTWKLMLDRQRIRCRGPGEDASWFMMSASSAASPVSWPPGYRVSSRPPQS